MIWIIINLFSITFEYDGNNLALRSNNYGFEGYGRIYNYTLQQDLNFFNYNFRVLDYCDIKERKDYTKNEEQCSNTIINANVSFIMNLSLSFFM